MSDQFDRVRRHFSDFLGEHYSWMLGDFDAVVPAQMELLRALGVEATPGDLAVDLGCGSGVHAIAAARLGFRVVAIDVSPTLLAELGVRAGSLAITRVEGDLRRFQAHVREGPGLVTCMGDTLTQLESSADVDELLQSIRSSLRPGGRVVLSFRDLTEALEGAARFLPVRADADRIITCFLEYEPTTVVVHDIVHRRAGETWLTEVHSYRKLRLSPAWVAERLAALGFVDVEALTERPMKIVAARCP